MIRPVALALLLPGAILPGVAVADAPLFIVDPSQMPFDLGPGAPANQPSRMSNSPSAAGNSSGAPGNGSGIRSNAPDNPANGPDGGRAIWADGEPVGYYTTNGGTLSCSPRRAAPARIAPRAGPSRCSPPTGAGAAPWPRPRAGSRSA